MFSTAQLVAPMAQLVVAPKTTLPRTALEVVGSNSAREFWRWFLAFRLFIGSAFGSPFTLPSSPPPTPPP